MAQPAAAPHKNTYDKEAFYGQSSVPTLSFGSTKGMHVRGNPTTVEAHVSASYKPAAARRLAKATAAVAKAGKKAAADS